MLARAVMLGAFCFLTGWALVLMFGQDGLIVGEEGLWQLGGIMVYASMLILPITALCAVVLLLRIASNKLRHHG